MGRGAHIAAALAGTIVPMVWSAPVRAADVPAGVDMAAYLGVWGDGRGYECGAEPGTETAPLRIEKAEDGGYVISAYEFYCGVKRFASSGATLVADVHCGHEGTEETSNDTIRLGLMSGGQLVFANGGLTVLSRCPAAQ